MSAVLSTAVPVLVALVVGIVTKLIATHLDRNRLAVADRMVWRAGRLVRPEIRDQHLEAALADVAHCEEVGKSPLTAGAAAAVRLLDVALRYRTIIRPSTVDMEPGTWQCPPGVRVSLRDAPDWIRLAAWRRGWRHGVYIEISSVLRPHHQFWIKSWPVEGETPDETAQRVSGQLRACGIVLDDGFEWLMVRSLEAHQVEQAGYRRCRLWDDEEYDHVRKCGREDVDIVGQPRRGGRLIAARLFARLRAPLPGLRKS